MNFYEMTTQMLLTSNQSFIKHGKDVYFVLLPVRDALLFEFLYVDASMCLIHLAFAYTYTLYFTYENFEFGWNLKANAILKSVQLVNCTFTTLSYHCPPLDYDLLPISET